MLKSYIKIAVRVFLRRKFFTFISLFGISFTLLVLMVATAILDNGFAPLAPEVNQDRSLYITRASMFGDHASWTSAAGFRLLDRYARHLPGVERMSLYTNLESVYTYPRGQKIGIQLKRTDAEFWRVLRFEFLEGGPYSPTDVEQARFVAVINRTVREKLFGGAPAAGRTIEADGRTYRVIGVVEDVSVLRTNPFAEMWAPYTTTKSDNYKAELMGNFNAIVLAADRKSIPGIQAELRSRMARVELPDPKSYRKLNLPIETTFEAAARELFANNREEDNHAGRLWAAIVGAALLFMLLPTINLVNLNVSRIMERASEIGVRKAFGASSWTLVGQFVAENLLLTLAGGVIGFALSLVVLRALTASDVIPYSTFHLNYRVFLYGAFLAVVFGILSGVYPAWRMSRLNPVEALKGASR